MIFEEYTEMTEEEKKIIDEVIAKQCVRMSDYVTHERIVAKNHEHLRELIDYVDVRADDETGDLPLRDLPIRYETDARGNAFETYCINLDLNFIDVSKVTDMSSVFSGFMCSSYLSNVGCLIGVNVNKWDVSNVTNMSEMFTDSKADIWGLDEWNVSKVTNMSGMFAGSYIDDDISKWDVSNVTDMCSMFADSQFDGDISKWDVSNVTDMREMFKHSQFQGDISEWNVSNVASVADIFKNSAFNKKRADRFLDKFSNAKDKTKGLGSFNYETRLSWKKFLKINTKKK